MSKQDPATSACQERTLQSAVLPESLRLKVKKSYIYIYQLQVTIIGIGSLTLLNHRSITLLGLLSSGKSFKTPKKKPALRMIQRWCLCCVQARSCNFSLPGKNSAISCASGIFETESKKELYIYIPIASYHYRHRQPHSSQS